MVNVPDGIRLPEALSSSTDIVNVPSTKSGGGFAGPGST